MEHWLSNILVFTLWLEYEGEERGILTREVVIATQGLTDSLGCTFETIGKCPSIFWYKQQLNDFPRPAVEMETWLWIIMAALLSGLIAGDSISPDKQEVSGKMGGSVCWVLERLGEMR
ncbi:unnamed protein product [Arctogadus glacialis]